MATYVNDLRLKEIATGDESGTWGTSTNTNLELIGEAFSFGTEAISTNADTHTTTIADGSTDPGRSIYLQYTGALDSTCTVTIGPNTVSKLWFIENATSGSQSIIIKQGSGATVTIRNGDVKAIYSDGAGSGGKMVDAFTDLHVNGLISEVDGNTSALTLRSTDADENLGPLLTFDRLSSSPADGDLTGKINFTGRNDASESTVYASMQSAIVDASDGTEDGSLQINTKLAGTGRSRILMNATETVFNDGSLDLNFRIESDSNTHRFFLQDDNIIMGHNSGIAVNGVGGALQIIGNTSATRSVSITNFAADANSPTLRFAKSRGSSIGTNTVVQSGDNLGLIRFAGDDGTDLGSAACDILVEVDGTPGTDDMPGRFVFRCTPDGSGSVSEVLRITDAGDVGIGDSAPSTKLHVTTSNQDDGVTIECTNGGTSAGPSLKLDRSSGTPADNDAIGEIEFSGRNDASEAVQYARIVSTIGDASDGTEDGTIDLKAMLDGVSRSRFFSKSTETVINDGGQNLDFRVETPNSTKFFFIDAGLDRVRIGNATHKQAGGSAKMVHMSANDSSTGLTIVRHQANASAGSVSFGKSRATADSDVTIVQDGDSLGSIGFSGADGTDIVSTAASINAEVDGTPGSNDMPGRLVFSTTDDGAASPSERARILNDGALLVGTTSQVTNFSSTAQFVAFQSTDEVCAKFICHQGTVTSADQPIIEVSFQDDGGLGTGSRFMVFTDENSTVGTIQSASTTSLEFGTGSDERLKENIVDAPSQLDKILDLNVRQFDWKKTGESEVGFVAQEVHKVLPNCASEGGDDPSKNPWSIFKAAFAPYLVSAIQEQQKQIEELKLEIAKLKGGS